MTTKLMPGRSTSRQATQTAPGDTSQDDSNGNADATATATVPDAEKLLIGALLDAGPVTVSKVLAWVNDDDLADPFYRAILAAIRDAAADGEAGVPAVNSRLMQSGLLGTAHGKPVQRRMVDAATSGACGLAARQYAADVVEHAQLRLLAGLCQVADAAATLPTTERVRYVLGYVGGLVKATTRVSELRQRAEVPA